MKRLAGDVLGFVSRRAKEVFHLAGRHADFDLGDEYHEHDDGDDLRPPARQSPSPLFQRNQDATDRRED